MFNLYELEQLVAFADNETLTKAAEKLNISQPTLTRSMRHIEQEFGVPLFDREKNRLSLNQVGNKAVDCARQILDLQSNAIHIVQEYDRRLHTITVESCAPKPLWSVASKTAQLHGDREISSKICPTDKIIDDVLNGSADIGILPNEYKNNEIITTPYISEQLYICATKEHALYNCDSVSFSNLNGFNCLLRDKIGFWADMCKEKMPSSKFLVQTDEEEFIELINNSSLLCFTTNLVSDYSAILKNRRIIPITDSCANVTYYIIRNKSNRLEICV